MVKKKTKPTVSSAPKTVVAVKNGLAKTAKQTIDSSKAPAKPSVSLTPIASASQLTEQKTQKPPSKKALTKKSTQKSTQIPKATTPADQVSNVQPESSVKQSLAKKPAGSLESDLRIFQIYYEAWQKELLDPNFAALDNSKSNSEFLEFEVFAKLLKSDYVKGAKLWGALSWRFTEKTGMSGPDLIKYIQNHPGYDVYFCNPYPENEALYHNLWLHGETAHPQFFALTQAVFQVTGLPLEQLTQIEPSERYSSANYFVATPRFWEAYIPWVMNVISLANKKLPPKVRDLMHSALADDRGLHKGASYVPFIVERLFPVFLKTAGQSLKAHKVALPERERELNVHLKLLREMKDVAHKTKSAWLAACWVNYRNLYFMQANGKAWCDKHLRNVTPTDIKFS